MNKTEVLSTLVDSVSRLRPYLKLKMVNVNEIRRLESYTGLLISYTWTEDERVLDILDTLYEDYEDGSPIDALKIKLLYEIDEASYDQVSKRLFMRLIPANLETLEGTSVRVTELPHKTIGDINVIYRILIDRDEFFGLLSVPVTNEMLRAFGVTLEKLQEDAAQSQMKLMPPTCMSMGEVIGIKDESGAFPLVVTNTDQYQGSSSILIPQFMRECAKKLGGGFFIIPSSVHECLIIKGSEAFDPGFLEEMIKSVNSTVVSEEEFLSDSLYCYNELSEEVYKYKVW